jgi:hypothetical protein
LPSSLTIVLSNTLVSSTCLPVSVCGTVERFVPKRLFSAPTSISFASPRRGPLVTRRQTGIPTTRLTPVKASCLDQPPRPVQEYKPDSHRLRPHNKGLALGPTNLQKTNCTAETLGFRWTGFAPVFALLMPASSLVCSPPLLTLRLQPAYNAPLPWHDELPQRTIPTFGGRLEPPYIIGAESHSASKLLRTL